MADSESGRKKRRLRAPSETVREKAVKAQETPSTEQRGPARAFFSGVVWPLQMIWNGSAWISHRPPLKQIGHALRWFFSLKPFRFLALILGFKFVADSSREVRLVSWPSWRQSLRLTGAVIIFSIIFGGLIAVVDYGLDKLFKQIILK